MDSGRFRSNALCPCKDVVYGRAKKCPVYAAIYLQFGPPSQDRSAALVPEETVVSIGLELANSHRHCEHAPDAAESAIQPRQLDTPRSPDRDGSGAPHICLVSIRIAARE